MRIGEGSSALVTDNHITHIRDTPFSGCPNGVGVLVGRSALNTFGAATVVHNLIDDYQKGGVVVDGLADTTIANSNAEVAYNEIDGIGPTAVIAQNGIQVSRDATANVHHNVVAHNIYSPATTTGEGILTFQVSSPGSRSTTTRSTTTPTASASTRPRTSRSAGTTRMTTSRTTGSSPTRTRPTT